MSVIVLPPQGDFVESSIPYPAGNWEGDFKSFPAACPALRLAEGLPCVSPCEAVCARPAGWVVSTHLQEVGTRCWGLFERLSREQFLPPNWTAEQTKNTGRLGQFTQPPRYILPSCQRIFRGVCVRQNAQGKGQCRRSILQQDKGRGSQAPSAQVTTPRNAGRFKGFRALKRGCMRGSHSTRWGHHWGLILLKCPRLAAFSGDQYGDEG